MKKIQNSKGKIRGFTLITGVLLLLAVILMGLLSLSTLRIQSGTAELRGRTFHELAAAADGCLEEALIRLKRVEAFRSAALSLGSNTCTIEASVISGENYRIVITSSNTNGQSFVTETTVRRQVAGQGTIMQIISYTLR